MLPLRFLHVADLHLGTPFITASNSAHKDLVQNLQEAPYTALKNLVQFCQEQMPNFVILSGDIYNDSTVNLRALLILKDAFESLNTLGIAVYFAYGNHDSLQKTFARIAWPSNVHVFGEAWQFYDYINEEDPSCCARIYGISHSTEKETLNLTKRLSPEHTSMLQIGVLHTSLEGENEKNKGLVLYAPCSVKDLSKDGFSYWALGHVHGHQIVSTEPYIVYPGSLQGLHINEQGEHGAYLVTFHECKPQANAVLEFFPLAPLVWKILSINLDSAPDDIMRLETFLVEEIQKSISAPNAFHDKCTDIIIRLKLHGHTPLYQELSSIENQTDLCESLIKKFHSTPRLWIKDIQSDLQPVFDKEEGLKREDLLGELLRHCQVLQQDEANLAKLYKDSSKILHSKINKCTNLIPIEEKEVAINNILTNAEQICIQALSTHKN